MEEKMFEEIIVGIFQDWQKTLTQKALWTQGAYIPTNK